MTLESSNVLFLKESESGCRRSFWSGFGSCFVSAGFSTQSEAKQQLLLIVRSCFVQQKGFRCFTIKAPGICWRELDKLSAVTTFVLKVQIWASTRLDCWRRRCGISVLPISVLPVQIRRSGHEESNLTFSMLRVRTKLKI